jgi:hypothetical protein
MFTAGVYGELQAASTTLTRGQQDYLNSMIARRNAFKPLEQTEESLESGQYYSFKEAVKAGCDLRSLRAAVGNRNNIAETLFDRLFADTQLAHYDAVKNIKAQIDREIAGAKQQRDVANDAAKRDACIAIFRKHSDTIGKISRLSMVYSYLPGEPEINQLLKELIDNRTFVPPVDIKQIQAVKEQQEVELLNTLIAFYDASGNSNDSRLSDLIPFGTFSKLQKTIAEKKAAAEKANAPAAVVQDLLDFARIKF